MLHQSRLSTRILMIACVLTLSGCISVEPKLQVTAAGPATAGNQLKPPVALLLQLKTGDEDLRKEFHEAMDRALVAKGITRSDQVGSTIEVRLERLRRVSRASRSWNGQLAGRVEYEFSLTFPSGERLHYRGDMGAKYGYNQAFGAVTKDALEKMAGIVTEEVAKRISSTRPQQTTP